MTAPHKDPLSVVAEGIDVFRSEMEAIDRLSKNIGRKTTRMIRVVIGLLTLFSIYLVVLTVNMADDLGAMIGSLDEMYVEFGTMSGEMGKITTHVVSMGKNVRGMPAIVANMQGLNTDVGGMLGAMETINGDMTAMDGNVGTIGNGTSEMAHRFQNVQRAMEIMQYDVHNMLRPMNAMPR